MQNFRIVYHSRYSIVIYPFRKNALPDKAENLRYALENVFFIRSLPLYFNHQPMLTIYGRSTIVKTIALCLLLILAGSFLPIPAGIPVISLSAGFLIFTLYFFRDPQRTIPAGDDLIVAPADGKILLIRKENHPVTGSGSTRISIFMSPFNVHVNRIPSNGRISDLDYHEGKYLMAFDHDSMNDNERMDTTLHTPYGPLVFTQVSGFLARRIVNTLAHGQEVRRGEPYGMIKFGSRLDIVLPPMLRVTVSEGEKTRAGETVLATLPATKSFA